MACAHCERIRKLAHQAKEKAMAHALRLAGLRAGVKDVETEGVAEQAASAATEAGKATGDQQAGDPSPAHGKRRVAKDSGTGAGKGRASVPVVRKAGRGETGSR